MNEIVFLVEDSARFRLSNQPSNGKHLRLTTGENGTHRVTISNHSPLRIGTLAAILDDIANHFEIHRQELLSKLKL